MAATNKENKDKNKALLALTSAALSLPGLNAHAAIPVANTKTNVSYGHYQESDGRMRVDVYHADAVIPLSDRLELAFSLDRDTYSGATPIFSIPEIMTNRKKIEKGTVTNIDLISAASTGVTTSILTTFGLNTLQEYKDGETRNKEISDAIYSEGYNRAETTFQLKKTEIEAEYNERIDLLDSQLMAIMDDFDQQKSEIMADYSQQFNKLNAEYDDNKIALEALKKQIETKYSKLNEQVTLAKNQIENQKAAIETRYQNQITQLNNLLNLYDLEINQLDPNSVGDIASSPLSFAPVLASQAMAVENDITTSQNIEDKKQQLEMHLAQLKSQYLLDTQQLNTQYTLDTEHLENQSKSDTAQLENQHNIEKERLETQYQNDKKQLSTEYDREKEQLETQSKSDDKQLETQHDLEKERLEIQSKSDTEQLNNQHNLEKNRLETQYQSDTERLTTNHENQLSTLENLLNQALESISGELAAEKTALTQTFENDKALVNTQLTFLADKFVTDQNSLVLRLSVDRENLSTQYKSKQNGLDDKLQIDEADLLKQFTLSTGFSTTDLVSNMASLNTQKSALETDKTALDANIARLNSDKTNLDNNIADLNSNKLNLNLQITTLISDIALLDSKISTLNVNQTKLNSDKTALGNQFTINESNLLSLFNADKSSLFAQFNTDTTNLANDLTNKQSTLELAFKNDEAALGTARDTAEFNYIADNPRPSGTVTIDFSPGTMRLSAYGGFANETPIASGSCSGRGASGCYNEDDFVIGIVKDTAHNTAHWHGIINSDTKNGVLEYHGDSSGVYIRAKDSGAFSVDSLKFSAPIKEGNKNTGPNDNWEILGFNQAVNKDLDQGGTSGKGTCSDYTTCVAYQKIANGFDGTLNLSSINGTFKNVNAIWIHYQGYPQSPDDQNPKNFDVSLDDIKLTPATPNASQIAWDNALNIFKTDYQNNTYIPALNALKTQYDSDLAQLITDNDVAKNSLKDQYDSDLNSLTDTFNNQKADLTAKYNQDLTKLNQDLAAIEQTLLKTNEDKTKSEQDLSKSQQNLNQVESNIKQLEQEDENLVQNIGKLTQDSTKLAQDLTLLQQKQTTLISQTSQYDDALAQARLDYQAAKTALEAQYNNDLIKLTADNETAKFTLKKQYDTDKNQLDSKLTALNDEYNKDIDNLVKKYGDGPETKKLLSDYSNQRSNLIGEYDKKLANLNTSNESAKASLDELYQTQLTTITAQNQKEIDTLTQNYERQKLALLESYNQKKETLKESYIEKNQILQDSHVQQSKALIDTYTRQKETLNNAYIQKNQILNETHIQQKETLKEDYKEALLADKALIDANKNQLTTDKATQVAALIDEKAALEILGKRYQAEYAALSTQNQKELDALTDQYQQKKLELSAEKDKQEASLIAARSQELENLGAPYIQQNQTIHDNNTRQTPVASTTESTSEPSIDSIVAATENQAKEVLTQIKNQQTDAANAAKEEQITQLEATTDARAKEDMIALYREILNTRVPQGNPTVQRFQVQPQETRSMPQFTAKYYFDATTLGISGGLSDEPDFLSNFGSVNLSHEFNDKLTTVSAGYGMTSNQITRSSGHSGGGHNHGEGPKYPALNEESTFHNFNAGLSQILGKNTLYQFSGSYTRQDGYLSNPYKYVYVRGEITPEEYYQMNESAAFDWKAITGLEVVGTELFREVRPNHRNMWSFSNRLNQHIPALDASVHFDYRFYTDDWGINSHTFELKWYQSLPWGLTVTPGIRYYSQSQADFFAPYFLSPRADGHYSSDFRLSGFGDLSGGVTVAKEFARGIKLEAGFEYVTHSGNLKLGGGGIGDYADFDYYIAHANLNIDLGARPFTLGGAGDHHSHHHHHGAPIPAGVMFGHMMNQADEIMVGYRYQYNVQSGAMLHGSDPISDANLVSNACPGNDAGCLYKPLKMHMQMHMLDLMYAPTDWLNLMVMPQLMSMDMDMSQPLRPFANFDEEEAYGHHAGTKHTSNDIGDTVATALVKLHDDGTHHVHAGIGISAPTGSIDAQLSQGTLKSTAGTEITPGSAVLQDYGMQLGSGTWDFKPSLTYTGHADDWGWGAQFSGTKRLEKNKYGYAYGDVFQATGWGSYAIFDWLSASVRGIYTWQGRIQGESQQNHEAISPVDFPSNYGGRFVDVGFGLNLSMPDGQFAGHNLSVEWQQPVMTDFNGSQLDRDGALAVIWNYAF